MQLVYTFDNFSDAESAKRRIVKDAKKFDNCITIGAIDLFVNKSNGRICEVESDRVKPEDLSTVFHNPIVFIKEKPYKSDYYLVVNVS